MHLIFFFWLCLLKRIANSLRHGHTANIRLERFVEALDDPATGLTFPALSGVRKQSVEVVERLFGQGVIDFMKNYNAEVNTCRGSETGKELLTNDA